MLVTHKIPYIIDQPVLFFILDCTEKENQSLGRLDISYSDKFNPYCNWIIGNVGIPQAVAIVSIHQLNFSGYGRYIRCTFTYLFCVFFPSTIYFIFSHNSFYLFVLQLLHQLLLRHVLQQSPTNCSKSIVKKGLSLGITSAWQLTFSCRHYCHQSDHFSYFSGNLLIRMTLICVHFNKLSRGCKHNKECGSNNEYCLTVLTVITSNCMMEMGLRFLLDMDGIPRPLT